MNKKRKSGILLHPTSLPGKYGIGTLGKEAYAFVDFLIRSGQSLWQVCPLGHTGYGDSPYQCFSAFAGNPLLIDLEILVQKNLLTIEDIKPADFSEDSIDYGKVIQWKFPILEKAFKSFFINLNTTTNAKFNNFIIKNNASS
jgi:4-alpha-glucanotransferase